MRNLLIISLIATMSLFVSSGFSQESSQEAVKTVKENQSKPTKNRRKKVMMCHECGKPEVDCECEGEEHGVKDDHGKDHNEDHKH